ncbi:ZIP family metal transporter [Crocinitomicaceae bacterium]|nr:ZIP family metal transporter [Crocinitomicaceae bacterium]
MSVMWTIFWLIFAVVVGGLVVLFLNDYRKSIIKLMLAFSGGFLLSVAFTHFIPELYATGGQYVGIFILAGFLVQLILEFFSGGIEHGHIHVHKGQSVPIALLISLSVHSFIEGIPLGSEELMNHDLVHHDHHHDGQSLLLGIVFHQFPVAIALMTLLLQSGISKMKAWGYLGLFAIMTPAGLLFGHFNIIPSEVMNFSLIMAVVVGMLLHISTTIIFETSENHKFNLIKLSAIVVGVAMAIGLN